MSTRRIVTNGSNPIRMTGVNGNCANLICENGEFSVILFQGQQAYKATYETPQAALDALAIFDEHLVKTVICTFTDEFRLAAMEAKKDFKKGVNLR